MNHEATDPLLIEYHSLSPDPLQRLLILSGIEFLLQKKAGVHTPQSMTLSKKQWNALCHWIQSGHGSPYWYVQDASIHIAMPCQHYILLGTHRLLADVTEQLLSTTVQLTQTIQPIDHLWSIAHQYVKDNIIPEMD